MIYFGCAGKHHGRGHALTRPDGGSSGREVSNMLEKAGIYPKIDGGFCPGMEGKRHHEVKQVEGHAKLTHHNGWTILSFWDRTGDSRGNSNSAFLEQGEHDFDYMVAKAKEVFPQMWERFTFEVRLV